MPKMLASVRCKMENIYYDFFESLLISRKEELDYLISDMGHQLRILKGQYRSREEFDTWLLEVKISSLAAEYLMEYNKAKDCSNSYSPYLSLDILAKVCVAYLPNIPIYKQPDLSFIYKKKESDHGS